MKKQKRGRAEERSARGVKATDLSASAIHRNLLATADGTWAWFVLSPVDWSYKSTGERDGLLNVATLRWADLAGHRVHLRITSHPTPYRAWAERLDRNSPNRLADVDGSETWGDYLAASQEAISGARLEESAVYLGVRFSDKRLKPKHLVEILDNDRGGHLSGEIAKARTALRRITEAVSKDGFGGKPVSARGLGWLMHVSAAPGAPVSLNALAAATKDWTDGDLDAFTAPVKITAGPLAKSVEVRALRDGREFVHHAAVLTASRFGERDSLNPAMAPWLAYAMRLPFPVEVSAILDVIDGTDMTGRATYDRRRAENIREHYQEHNERPPAEVERAIDDASRVEDEVSAGSREVAARVAGPIRVAVFGRNSEDVMSRVADLIDAYARDQRIEWVHSFGQWALLREFIPGEEHREHRGHVRVMPAYFAATAVPNTSNGLGDHSGPYLAQVVGGGRRAVMLDPHYGPRHDMSGMAIFSGDLGSGKSATAGAIAEPSARRGHRTIIFDPSGPLANLTELPHLARDARHIELSGAAPGTLNPFMLIPDPRRQDYPTEDKWRLAVKEADAERRDLMIDTLVALMPPQVITSEPGATTAIENAVNAAGGRFGTSPWRVIHALEADGEYAKTIATRFRQAAEMKGGALIFPESETADPGELVVSEATLTVITMRGLVTPPQGTDRVHWSRQERMAVPTLHLASRFASRAMYEDQEPKVIFTDEGGIIASGGSSFKSFLLRGSRDSRKHNTFFALLTQNPSDADQISPEITNLLGMAMVGRSKDERSARACLRLLGVPEGYGYEKVLTRLETGQFLMRDWHGRVEKVQVALGHRPQLLDALNTSPRAYDDEPFLDLVEAGA